MKPDEFIEILSPMAMESSVMTGIPASFTVAEAALESGWGNSLLAKKASNLFGVKADRSWHGDTLEIRTREYVQGDWGFVPALWRKYANMGECLTDHAAFLRGNKRYKAAFQCKDGESFAIAVANAGYATDPDYAEKIISIIRQHNLDELDKVTA